MLAQMDDIRKRALAGEDFGQLADAHSRGPGAGQGGDLGYFKKGQYVVVGSGQQPGGSQDGKGGDGSLSGVNKMLNTLLTAAGVTKTGGAPTDDFGPTVGEVDPHVGGQYRIGMLPPGRTDPRFASGQYCRMDAPRTLSFRL